MNSTSPHARSSGKLVSPVTSLFENNQIRTVDINGDIWFVAVDVCQVMGHRNPRQAVSRLDEDEKGVQIVDTLGGPQGMTIISEAGMY